jgi:P4 family phage/plasmid primase-like protien
MKMALEHKNLKSFLTAYSKPPVADMKPTNTRIGDKGSIRGGKYFITGEDEPEFYHHYFNEVVQGGGCEYLTEKQLGEGGPIAVDLDFRFDSEIRVRQHNETDLQDIISVYLDILKTLLVFTAVSVEFMVYVFEKPNVNIANEDVTKDGIHLLFGIQMNNTLQSILRDKMVHHFEQNPNNIDIISDLPLKDTCTWNTVFDEGVTKGSVNWQLYGSRKPHNEAYQLSAAYKVSIDESDGEFCLESSDISIYHRDVDEFKKLSVRYRDHPKFDLTPEAKMALDRASSGPGGKGKKGSRVLTKTPSSSRLKVVMKNPVLTNATTSVAPSMSIECVSNEEQLNEWRIYLESCLDDNAKDYRKRDAHRYAMALPEMFYKEGSYNDWIRLAFALKNTDEMLFVTWALVSAKKPGFDYSSIGDLYDQWCKIDKKADGQMLTWKSIMYWAKEYNHEGFEAVKNESLGYYVDLAIENDNDREVAQVLFFLSSERFVCSTLTNNNQTWYEFDSHRWILDKGLRIRKSGISEELYEVFYDKHVELSSSVQTLLPEGNEYNILLRKNKNVTGIMNRCHSNSQKTHIAKEAAELFWDRDFGDKLDQDKWTLCFNNGVINLQTGEFRDGRPMDYISKTTNIPYITDKAMNIPENQAIKGEIIEFMEKLFPDVELREYVWEHLASTMVGANFNQTFNIYKGSGSNGKSLLTELVSKSFGEYCNPTAPIGIITSKRQSLGGTSSELYALKSIRYAVFQEPTKGMVLNEGAMKEMTGDAKIQARELYCASTNFNQMFSLAVCTNSLFEIKSQDEGTWRRLRIINFMSCFKNKDEYDKLSEKNKKSKYIHIKDPSLKDKLDIWAPVFASMLVKRCVANQGIVKDCNMVLEETQKYRLRQDLIGQFVAEKVRAAEGKNITRQALSQTWKIWLEENQASNAPKMFELTEYMNSQYTMFGKAGWSDAEIIYEEQIEDDGF